MLKYKNKIIATIVIIAFLSATWFYGGNYNMPSVSSQVDIVAAEASVVVESVESIGIEVSATFVNDVSAATDLGESSRTYEETYESEAYNTAETSTEFEVENITTSQDKDKDNNTAESEETPSQDIVPPPQESTAPSLNVSNTPAISPNPIAADETFTVMLSVRVDTILGNMNLLDIEKHELIPPDGVIFPATVVVAYEGESVFNVLQREMRRNGIHMAFRNVPIFGSSYVMGINNIFEFDVGELSGWMYRVNGRFPNFGSSLYILSPDDVIEWIYTVDLGRDVGDIWEGW